MLVNKKIANLWEVLLVANLGNIQSLWSGGLYKCLIWSHHGSKWQQAAQAAQSAGIKSQHVAKSPSNTSAESISCIG